MWENGRYESPEAFEVMPALGLMLCQLGALCTAANYV